MMESLDKMQSNDKVCVYRSALSWAQNQQFCMLDCTELVPGDLVALEAGMRVPADLRIIACSDGTMVDNSALTGESISEERKSKVEGPNAC